jgi:Phage integrase family
LADRQGENTRDKDSRNRAMVTRGASCVKTLRELYESEDRQSSPYVFPGRSYQTKSKKIYSRRRMFERIQKVTAIKKYMRQHPEVTYKQALEVCQKENFKGGIHLAPKDLRDYFCTEIAATSDDPAVAMRLMRHTSLATTTKYMRIVEGRMRQAVAGLGEESNNRPNLGSDSGGDSMPANGRETSDLANLQDFSALAKILENQGFLKRKRLVAVDRFELSTPRI